jgi:hypothetical protein
MTLLVRAGALSCSMGQADTTDPAIIHHGPLPRNTEIRLWLATAEAVGVELTDPSGHRVATNVETHTIPGVGLYRDVRQHVIARPLHDLSPGRHTFRIAWGPRHQLGYGATRSFKVSDVVRRSPPAPPRDLMAQLVTESCAVNWNPDCTEITGDCHFLRIVFEDANREHWDHWLTYHVEWVPVSKGEADNVRRRSAHGFVTATEGDRSVIRIPTWWFDSLVSEDDGIEVALRAVDHSGATSPMVKAFVRMEKTLPAPSGSDGKGDPRRGTRRR